MDLIERVAVVVPDLLIVATEPGLEFGGDLDVWAALNLDHVTVTVDGKALIPAACLTALVASKDSLKSHVYEISVNCSPSPAGQWEWLLKVVM